jgi:hypothetical protein
MKPRSIAANPALRGPNRYTFPYSSKCIPTINIGPLYVHQPSFGKTNSRKFFSSTEFLLTESSALTVGLTNDYKTNGVYIDQVLDLL